MNTKRVVRLIGRFGLVGATSGVALAAVLMTLERINLYPLDGFIDHLTFRLCPLYILGFSSISWIGLIAVVIVSNALLYGAIFEAVGAVVGALKKGPDQFRVSSI
jgi:hypothetical protein